MVGINRNFAGINNNTKLTTLNKATSKNVVNANLQVGGKVKLPGNTASSDITFINLNSGKGEGRCETEHHVDLRKGEYLPDNLQNGDIIYRTNKDGSVQRLVVSNLQTTSDDRGSQTTYTLTETGRIEQ